MRKLTWLKIFFSASTAILLAGCDGGPTAPGNNKTEPAITASITCNGQPGSCSIDFNATASISWNSTNATSCTVVAGGWSGTSGTQSTGPLSASKDYEVECKKEGATPAKALVRVIVGSLAKPGPFNLTSTCVPEGAGLQRGVVRWTTSTNASSYLIERRAWKTGSWVSVTTLTTERTLSEVLRNDITYFYRVTAINSSGQTLSSPPEQEVCNEVKPPPSTGGGGTGGGGSGGGGGGGGSSPTIPGGPGSPTIGFSSVPPKGSSANLVGFIQHVLTSDHKVAVYIKVGGWWTKPYFASPLTPIGNDGVWVTDITTGGSDEQATEIAAFLVTNSHSPVTASNSPSLPISVNGKDVLAVVSVGR